MNTKVSPPVMLCMGRHRLGEAGCSNSRSIPYYVLMLVNYQTMYAAIRRAVASQNLTENEKRQIEIEGELSDLQRKSENLIELLAEHGKTLPGIKTKLDKLSVTIEKLEAEQALLRATPVQMSNHDAIGLQDELLEEGDMERLNAMLRGVGYRIVCDDTTITVDEESIESAGNRQVYVYKGSHRPTETYRLVINGEEVSIPMPNSKIEAAKYQAYLESEAGRLS
ncbi:hypothetical protein D3C85_1151200 [compost metagenome]